MIRVMYVINESGLGGAEQSLLDMLTAIGSRVSPVVIIPSGGMIEERLRQMEVTYYIVPFETDYRRIGLYSGQEEAVVYRKSFRAALQLREIIRQEKIQIVHTNSSVSNAGAIAAMMEKIPHIWHIREFLEEDFDSEFVNKELKRELFACADGMISISECIRDAYQRKYHADSICIYNGLDRERFLESISSEKAGNRFLLAGNITPGKGQLEAVKAVERLAMQGIEVHLYIVGAAGNDWYRWLLKKYVREHGLESCVHILGFRKDLRSLREKCGFAIVSSRMEALGRVTIEAMLAGCVVIGADTGGTAEILGQDGSRGYLYRQGSDEDLARVMRYAMERKEQNREIRKTAQAYALLKFDLNGFVGKITGLYERVLEHGEDTLAESRKELLQRLYRQYEAVKDADTEESPWAGENTDKSLLRGKMIQRWLSLKLEGRSLADGLLQRGIRSAALYGMGYLGCCLYDELDNGGIRISYVMDRRPVDADGIVKVVRIEDALPQTDGIIITVLGDNRDLQKLIEAKCDAKVMLLSELMDWCENGEDL